MILDSGYSILVLLLVACGQRRAVWVELGTQIDMGLTLYNFYFFNRGLAQIGTDFFRQDNGIFSASRCLCPKFFYKRAYTKLRPQPPAITIKDNHNCPRTSPLPVERRKFIGYGFTLINKIGRIYPSGVKVGTMKDKIEG
ncbi:MAG: hypothetical protein LUQ65_01400 [Candidatus Helarchaeota archaeon]|nr:hypothetical protein [Candidatus Helarchaeota archaeon]